MFLNDLNFVNDLDFMKLNKELHTSLSNCSYLAPHRLNAK